MPDCLLIHTPKFQNHYPAFGNYTSIQWMAVGIFALADSVVKAGHSAKILHLGLEKNLNPSFALDRYLFDNPTRVVAFSVQFHQQLYDTLRAIKVVKRFDPSILVVLGGFTATFFARELLGTMHEIDAIVLGEGEKSLPVLVAKAKLQKGHRDFSRIPNLVWRQGGEIISNAVRYTASAEDLAQLDFENLSLLEHYAHYVRMPEIFLRLNLPSMLRWKLSEIFSRKKRNVLFALSVGRGCFTNCVYCGGGVRAHKLINGRTSAIFRPQEKVVASIRRLKEFGYQGAHLSYDPRPHGDDYYTELFKLMREENVEFDFSFSAWGLPSKRFIYEFSKTFSSLSSILISPEAGNEALRKRTRGLYYSNAELIDTLEFAEKQKVRTTICFSLGMPGETKENFAETALLKAEIERRFTLSKVEGFSVEIEPASPWHLHPERYNIELLRRTLHDFVREQAEPTYSSIQNLGYWQKEYLGLPMNSPADYAATVEQVKDGLFGEHKLVRMILSISWKVVSLLGLTSDDDVELSSGTSLRPRQRASQTSMPRAA